MISLRSLSTGIGGIGSVVRERIVRHIFSACLINEKSQAERLDMHRGTKCYYQSRRDCFCVCFSGERAGVSQGLIGRKKKDGGEKRAVHEGRWGVIVLEQRRGAFRYLIRGRVFFRSSSRGVLELESELYSS